MEKPTLSIAVIAINEEDRIWRLLKSIAFADEVIVVDSGSTDGTQALCEQAGAKVIFKEWTGYADQKQFAMMQTSSEWILNLDADEAVSDALAKEIQATILNVDRNVEAFSIPRLSRYLGRWIKHGGWYPDRKVRLVRRRCGNWVGDTIHEQLLVHGEIERLLNPIFHYVYRDISDQIRTISRFSDLYVKERGAKGGWFVIAGVLHALGKFIECYLWKLGFLDGLPGLVIAMNSAWYIFLKHAKSWESGLQENGSFD
jgi:glycosyltransferase involved in cell wall biosynthesis